LIAKVTGLMNLQKNYSLKYLNTFGVDVIAKYFLEIHSEKELDEFIQSDLRKNEQLLIIGGGSNILFTRDYDGVVLKFSKKGISVIEQKEDFVLIESSAGELWDDLVKYTVRNKLYGIENLSLIPGSVGAAPIQNIGAYGTELKDVLHSVEYYDLDDGSLKNLSNAQCNFGYRNSIFKNELKNKFIITKVILKLSLVKKFNLSYKSLSDELKNTPEHELTIETVSEAVRNIRRSKLPDPDLLGNAGSFFKNPEMDNETFQLFINKFPDAIYFEQSDNTYKISAGWLIEKCGYKGKRIGNVGAYEKQALIITNYGGATGNEILEYAEKIISDVKNNFGIELNSEVNIIQ